ncbi:hypothetical protein [Vibrio jasicida]|uniref:hypothetical protein n=1 Tax=Vibrio jasicida TaxID=766224 RepID=UPI0005ED7876|nr:hypothetical protein [Vibrio jasicida]
MNYKSRFETAINKTKELGLTLTDSQYPFREPLSYEEKNEIFQACVWSLYDIGFTTSSTIAQQCAFVHTYIREMLKEVLGVNSYITIGDFYRDNYTYCEMSYESILQELAQPDMLKPIKAHVWLTLTDGTIIDCTYHADADVLCGRGEFLIEKCIMVVDSDQVENKEKGYHRPYLVGDDFLIKTKSIPML